MTPEERATAATWLELAAEAGARPVVSHAGGTHWHLVIGIQPDDEQLGSIPWCRRAARRSKRRRQGVGPGNHDQWREASLRQLVDMPLCSECRHRMIREIEGP